jgi:glycosyltransferase involved in cell wall biosynthesis
MTNKSNQLVSIVLCFYNEERFLEEAVASVMTQDHTDWELFLVDDGSSDKSTSIAKMLASQHEGKVFYLEHEGHTNKGLSASRNLGIRNTTGNYIAFIDADDVWLPEKLTQQLSIFKQHPEVTLILEASLYWYSWNDPKNIDVPIPIGTKQDVVYHPPQLMLNLYPLGKGAAPCPSGFMARRGVLERNLFEESFRSIYQMYEDQGFLCKMYLHETIFVSSACNNKYRQRPASLVSAVHDSGKYDTVRKYYLEWFQKYLKESKVNYPQVNKLLKDALMPYHNPLRYKLMVYFPKRVKGRMAGLLVKMGLLNYNKK